MHILSYLTSRKIIISYSRLQYPNGCFLLTELGTSRVVTPLIISVLHNDSLLNSQGMVLVQVGCELNLVAVA